MQSHHVAMEKRNQEVFVWPVVGRPTSPPPSSLSSSVWCLKTFTLFFFLAAALTVILLQEYCGQKKLRNSIGLSFLYVHVIIVPQGFCH